jgi:hypothetical protein
LSGEEGSGAVLSIVVPAALSVFESDVAPFSRVAVGSFFLQDTSSKRVTVRTVIVLRIVFIKFFFEVIEY